MAATSEDLQQATAASEQQTTRTVLLALDESDYSQRALEYYVEAIHKPTNAVVIAHCLEMPYMTTAGSVDIVTQILAEKRASAKATKKKYTDMLAEKGVKCKVAFSDFDVGPGNFIVETAEKEQASLIVLGSRGLGTIRRTIMGSVSDYVVHHAHCPVLVCRQ